MGLQIYYENEGERRAQGAGRSVSPPCLDNRWQQHFLPSSAVKEQASVKGAGFVYNNGPSL